MGLLLNNELASVYLYVPDFSVVSGTEHSFAMSAKVDLDVLPHNADGPSESSVSHAPIDSSAHRLKPQDTTTIIFPGAYI